MDVNLLQRDRVVEIILRIFSVARSKFPPLESHFTDSKDLDRYLKLVYKAVDKIGPGLKICSVYVAPTVINSFLDEIRDRCLWRSWLKVYMIFADRFVDRKIAGEYIEMLFWAGEYDLCCEMLAHHQHLNWTDFGEFNSLVDQTLDLCLSSECNEALCAAEKICIGFNLHEKRGQLAYMKKRIKIKTLVLKQKWRIAVEISSSQQHKTDIFFFLMENRKFREAQEAYELMGLGAFSIPPVSQRELDEQALEVVSTYLSLPLPFERIIMIDTPESLAHAEGMLQSTLFMFPDSTFFVGVDCKFLCHVLDLSIAYFSSSSI